METRKHRSDAPADPKESSVNRELAKIQEDAEHQTLEGISFEAPVPFKADVPDVQNPEAAHRLYYKNLAKLKRRYLPGPTYKSVRQEIDLFLKGGQVRDRDGKMALTRTMAFAVQTFVDWLNKYGGGNVHELYMTFVELNRKQKESAKKTT